MPCYRPINAWRAAGEIFFNKTKALERGFPSSLQVPCGRCIGCKLAHAQKWATRCVHESQSHLLNTFATITYDDEHLPPDFSLRKSDLQLFFKRLRYHFGSRFSYFACGEYGGRFGRPHYHACFFGLDDDTKVPLSSSSGNTIYFSPLFTHIWANGNVVLGDLNYRSAAYVARYTLKKVSSNFADITSYYSIPHPLTGEVLTRAPEFSLQSRRPAIGREWIDEFYPEVYAHDACFYLGRKISVPRYYDKRLEILDENLYARIKSDRLKTMVSLKATYTERRLCDMECVKICRQHYYLRPFDGSTIYD